MTLFLFSIISAILIGIIIICIINKHEQYNNTPQINPGFGTQIIESAPEWNPDMINQANWNEGSFGSLVSNLEDRKNITAIRSIL